MNTHFDMMNMDSFNVFLFQKMFTFGGFLLVSISALFFSLFDFFSKVFSRASIFKLKPEEAMLDAIELEDEESEVFEEIESPKLVFKFQFQTQTFEEFSKKFRDIGMETDPSTSTNKYEFNSRNDFEFTMENPNDISFCVKELYTDSNNGLFPKQDFLEENIKDEEAVIIEGVTEEDGGIMEEESREVVNGNECANALDHSSDSNELETLWEHQHLIEQLKMELKKVRATGLPTILEESESPKVMEDLKPWKIDEKFHHVDRMSDLHKLYKSYRERMRKFDILNYQKMYAIGFLQSKDPLQSISSHKSSSPAITSLLHQNLRLRRRKKSNFDPTTKFIKELHSDLEMVYVGQLCLSWEILHWQYEKAMEIWETDPYSLRRFNEVACEFQQFQVLIQRFIENELFEGPRVQNYVKNRCVLRNLLQVPVIREDSVKDKRKGRRKRIGDDDNDDDDDGITSDMLVEIMEESIRIFWRFIRADKDANVVIKNSRKGTQIEPLEPADLELLTKVQTSLQKKDKKLKDILRSGNCILRKLKKNEEENSNQVLYFFSQVDLKLVARVMNMSKVTKDQLFWCHNKLSKINFVHRKINVEPSFLLFPC
ncbi:hypothetical protein ES319_D09G017300v1 [Gossypium barbadense]|uniref:Ribosomal protein L34Ae n=3 Tax=Gossypium TaxID=3633 RepID=A0A5J5PXM6_GOSBA|nr:hypothetical protein ES319_D09G017300v1 [Gossypium barbadense]TYG52345.1 hypothetical protein ES288_D09G019500v1 [Gossypium darwinii]